MDGTNGGARRQKALDARDEQLLALLRANARTPLVTLAKKLGLSRSAAQERLKRLEDAGVIAGYTITLGAADTEPARAWMMLRYAPGRICAELVPEIRKLPEVRHCHSLAGSVDLLLLVEAPTQAALMAVREKVAAINGIAEVQTAPVMKRHF